MACETRYKNPKFEWTDSIESYDSDETTLCGSSISFGSDSNFDAGVKGGLTFNALGFEIELISSSTYTEKVTIERSFQNDGKDTKVTLLKRYTKATMTSEAVQTRTLNLIGGWSEWKDVTVFYPVVLSNGVTSKSAGYIEEVKCCPELN